MMPQEICTTLTRTINQLREDLGIKAVISIDGITDNLLDKLVTATLSDPCIITNPKELTKEEIKAIYEIILK